MRSGKHSAWWVAAFALVVASGCGSSGVYPVRGKVTFDGKPMRGGGTISLVPLMKQDGKAAGGEIAEDGTYQLTTHKPGDGSMPGKFRVLINQSTFKEPERTPDGEKAAKPVATVGEADRIPAVYSDPLQSPLEATVEAKSLNEINFDLKRGAAAPSTRPPGAMGNRPWRDPVAWLQR